jgi:hypothetical protein
MRQNHSIVRLIGILFGRFLIRWRNRGIMFERILPTLAGVLAPWFVGASVAGLSLES